MFKFVHYYLLKRSPPKFGKRKGVVRAWKNGPNLKKDKKKKQKLIIHCKTKTKYPKQSIIQPNAKYLKQSIIQPNAKYPKQSINQPNAKDPKKNKINQGAK